LLKEVKKIERSLTPISVDCTIETQNDKVYYVNYVLNLCYYSEFTVLCAPRERESATRDGLAKIFGLGELI